MWAKNCPFWSTKINIYVSKAWKKINQRACYNRIWSWSPVPCEKHGPRASVTTKTSAFGLGFCLLSPSGHVFHTARETMIKSYIPSQPPMQKVFFQWHTQYDPTMKHSHCETVYAKELFQWLFFELAPSLQILSILPTYKLAGLTKECQWCA